MNSHKWEVMTKNDDDGDGNSESNNKVEKKMHHAKIAWYLSRIFHVQKHRRR